MGSDIKHNLALGGMFLQEEPFPIGLHVIIIFPRHSV